jgi:hypothetical protein
MSLIPSAPFTDPTGETTGVTAAGMDGFLPSGDWKATGLDRFDLPLTTDFWGRILVRR